MKDRYKTSSGLELDLSPEEAKQLARLTEIELIEGKETADKTGARKNGAKKIENIREVVELAEVE